MLGLLVRPAWLLDGVALAALLGALLWHVRDRKRVPWGRESVQASRPRVERGRGWFGLLYFGALLGVGLLTEMATPLVLAGAALAAAQGLPWALLYGAGFGLGRSTPAWVAALRRRGVEVPAVVAAMTEANRRRARWVGAAVAVAGLWLAVVGVVAVVADRVA